MLFAHLEWYPFDCVAKTMNFTICKLFSLNIYFEKIHRDRMLNALWMCCKGRKKIVKRVKMAWRKCNLEKTFKNRFIISLKYWKKIFTKHFIVVIFCQREMESVEWEISFSWFSVDFMSFSAKVHNKNQTLSVRENCERQFAENSHFLFFWRKTLLRESR